MDPNTLYFDPDPEFLPNLDPDPGPLSVESLNGECKSSILYLLLLIYPIFTRVDPDPQWSWIRIQFGSGSGSTILASILVPVNKLFSYWCLYYMSAGARSTNDLDRLGEAVVPAYRPAPDYETAVLSKFQGNRITQAGQPYQSTHYFIIKEAAFRIFLWAPVFLLQASTVHRFCSTFFRDTVPSKL